MKLSEEALSVRNELYDGMKARLSECGTKLPKLQEAYNALYGNIAKVLFPELMQKDVAMTAELKSDKKTAEFLTMVLILAYTGYIPNDSNILNMGEENAAQLEELKQQQASYEAEIEAQKAASKPYDTIEKKLKMVKTDIHNRERVDFRFGWEDVQIYVGSVMSMLVASGASDQEAETRLTSSLLSGIREISASEYCEHNYVEKDIFMVFLLATPPVTELNKFIMGYIASETEYGGKIPENVRDILSVYKYVYQDSFGLRPYEGVLTTESPFVKNINEFDKLSTIKGATATFSKLSSVLFKHFNITESSKRQFDVHELVYNNGKIVYYPAKCLEYAMGRELTTYLSIKMYKPHVSAISWESYEQQYVSPQITQYMTEAVYYSLERSLKSVYGKDFSFDSQDFAIMVGDPEQKRKLILLMQSPEIIDSVKVYVNKVKRSLCTVVCLVKFNNLGGKVNAVTVRLVDTLQGYKADGDDRPPKAGLSAGLTQQLFGHMSSNESIVYSDADDLAIGKKSGPNPLPFRILEYRHDFDAELSDAEPLFGYKAVEMFASRGMKLSWDRILIGEDTKGTPVFSMAGKSPDCIHLQNHFVHNIIAGSRSGKGVTTMNILGSAIAAGKPIFYIDRKPDMSVMMHELTNGNMFIVNGGQYTSSNDPRGVLSPVAENSAIRGWKNAYAALPDWLKVSDVFGAEKYEGTFGDMVYYRACMLMLAIFSARLEFASDPVIYNKLGGRNGLVVIFDEFKNWQEWEITYFGNNGVFGEKHRPEKAKFEKYEKLKQAIETTQLEMQHADKELAIAKAQIKLQAQQRELQNVITPIEVYCYELFDKYAKSIQKISSDFSAGFSNLEGAISDIFLIGQHINYDGYAGTTGNVYTVKADGKFNNTSEVKDKSVMRGILSLYKSDYLMGYNTDYGNDYLGAGNENSLAAKWVQGRKYWAYIGMNSDSTEVSKLRTESPASSDMMFLKTYLVLNNAMEFDPRTPMLLKDANGQPKLDADGNGVPDPDYEFVRQCRDRVNGAVPHMWEEVRRKHLSELFTANPEAEELFNQNLAEIKMGTPREDCSGNGFYGSINNGIGFEGLVQAIARTNGVNIDFHTSLKTSLDIATYVAVDCMGYTSVYDFLFDMSPSGLFSIDDVVNSIKNPGYFANKEVVLPTFKRFDMLGGGAAMQPEGADGDSVFNTGDGDLQFDDGEDDFNFDADDDAEGSNSSGSAGDSGNGGSANGYQEMGTGGFHIDPNRTVFDDSEEADSDEEDPYDDYDYRDEFDENSGDEAEDYSDEEEQQYSGGYNDNNGEGIQRMNDATLRMIATTFARAVVAEHGVSREILGADNFELVVQHGMKFLRGCGL